MVRIIGVCSHYILTWLPLENIVNCIYMYPCSFLFMWIKLSFTTVFFPVIIKKIETSISIMQKLHSGKKFSSLIWATTAMVYKLCKTRFLFSQSNSEVRRDLHFVHTCSWSNYPCARAIKIWRTSFRSQREDSLRQFWLPRCHTSTRKCAG